MDEEAKRQQIKKILNKILKLKYFTTSPYLLKINIELIDIITM